MGSNVVGGLPTVSFVRSTFISAARNITRGRTHTIIAVVAVLLIDLSLSLGVTQPLIAIATLTISAGHSRYSTAAAFAGRVISGCPRNTGSVSASGLTPASK